LKPIIKILVTVILFQKSYAQFEITDIGAKAISMGGAFTSLADNSSAVYYNPSGISQLPFREVSVFYSPSPFGLKELAYGSINYVEPTRFGVFALSAKTYGFELYREITATISYANNFGKKIHYGLNLNYFNLSIKNYGSASSFGIDVGVLAYLTDFMRWGFAAFNVNRPSVGTQKDKLPQVYRGGISVQPKNYLNFILDVEKDTRFHASVKFGMEYNVYEMVDIRSGIGTAPSRFSGGIGFNYSLFNISYAFNTHQDLGLTHQGSISINFGGEKARKKIRNSLSDAFGN